MITVKFIIKKTFAPAMIGAAVILGSSHDAALATNPAATNPAPVASNPAPLAVQPAPFGVKPAPGTYIAQMRTYVSGKGSDSNPCSVAQPCQTLKAALTLTMQGGEIFVLDSANYGPVTIGQAVSITAAGAGAGILIPSGNAVVINAGPNEVVNLRGLVLDGGQTGTTGIQFNSGAKLTVQNAIIRNFTGNGINFAPTGAAKLFVTDTTVNGNAANGILIAPASSSEVIGTMARISATGNGVAVLASGSNVNLTMTDTVAGNNTYGVGAITSSTVMVRNSTFNNNTIGIAADQSALVRVGQSTLTANGTGFSVQNGAQLASYGDNNLSGNAVDGAPTSILALQ